MAAVCNRIMSCDPRRQQAGRAGGMVARGEERRDVVDQSGRERRYRDQCTHTLSLTPLSCARAPAPATAPRRAALLNNVETLLALPARNCG